MVVVVVEDLFFLAKIEQIAEALGISIQVVKLAEARKQVRALSASMVIVDLNQRSGGAIDLVKALKADAASARVPVIGFLSHVQADLASAGRAAGCDRVLARSAITRQLPALLKELRQPRAAREGSSCEDPDI